MVSSLAVKCTKPRCAVSVESAINASSEKAEGKGECAADTLAV